MLLGKRIKELREEQKLLQRQLAAILEIDTPMFSKIERGDRLQFKVDEKELLTLSSCNAVKSDSRQIFKAK